MTSTNEPVQDPIEAASAKLQSAEEATDEERLRVLEDLYESLEKELDRDVDQTGTAGR